jgi:hypothetical protein
MTPAAVFFLTRKYETKMEINEFHYYDSVIFEFFFKSFSS